MVGARQGWAEVAYGNVPSAPPDAMGALRVIETDPRIDVRILSGMAQLRPADVMRGEETQIAGFIAAHPE
jgi:2-dehydro-3-deoxygalactonokinase